LYLYEKQIAFLLLNVINFVEPGVSHVFCGHYHRNCIKFYKNIEIVTTNAIGAPMGPMEPSGLRIVQIYENNIIHAYYPLEKMPRSIIN
jgi:hypothetical protein